MKKISHLLLTGILALTLISCGEDNDSNPSTTYNPRNAEITEPITWKATDSVLVDCILAVNSTVTIEAGCTVTFTGNGYLKVGQTKNGAIIANGTAEKPIRFTYKRNNLTSVIQSGSWYGIHFGERNMVNTTKLRYCIFEGAGKENTPCIELYKTTLDMEYCTISNCAGTGLKAGLLSGFKNFSHNEISSCDGYVLSGIPEAIVDLDETNTFTPTNNKNIALLGGSITFDCTLTKQAIPYTVLGNIFVEYADLTIEAGTTLTFTDETSLNIGREENAALIAIGTEAEPILLTSAATSPHAGDWKGLVFYEYTNSTRTNLQYVTIDYAGQSLGLIEGAIQTYSPIYARNTTIKNSKTHGIWCNDDVALTNFTNNTIQGCGKNPISTDVNQAHTIDSTNTFTDNTYNYIRLTGMNLTGNVRWRKQNVPYYVEDGLYISNPILFKPAAKLTLAKGSTLLFGGMSIIVGINGSLSAVGTEQDSITFSSISDTPKPGDWIGIFFDIGYGRGNNLTYCTVEYAGEFSEFNIGINTSHVSITHSTIRNSLLHGIYQLYNEAAYTPTLSDNAFSGNLGDNLHYESQPE